MTDDRTLKQAIRRRMERTGEKYTDARRGFLAELHQRSKQPRKRREWEPPPDVLPVTVPCDSVLARTNTLLVAARSFAAYPTCFEFLVQVWAVRRPERGVAHFDMSLSWAGRLRDAGSTPPLDIFRLAVECADGSRASTLEMPGLLSLGADDPPPERVIWTGSGSAGAGQSEQRYSVWPLPPAGPLTLVCEWPANGIPVTRIEIDGTAILQAGIEAERLRANAYC